MRILSTIYRTGIVIFAALSFNISAKEKVEGTEYYYKKKYSKAIESLDEYYQKNPNDSEANMLLAEAMAAQLLAKSHLDRALALSFLSRYNQAFESVESAKKIAPYYEDIEDIENEVEKRASKNKPFAHLTPTEKKDYNQKILEANKAWKVGDIQRALDMYAYCLSLAPKSPEANEGYSDARSVLNKKADDKRLQELILEAEILQESGRLPQAMARYDEYLRFKPEDKKIRTTRNKVAKMLEKKRVETARVGLARSYFENGKKLLLVSKFDRAIEQFQLGRGALSDFTQWDKLIKEAELKRSQELTRTFEENLFQLQENFQRGLLAMTRGKFQAAIGEFETVTIIAEKYKQTETARQANELLRVARENLKYKEEEVVSPENPYYHLVSTLNAMGQEAYRNGQLSKAREHYLSILELFPRNAKANRYLVILNIEQNPETRENVINKILKNIEEEQRKNPIEAKRLLELIKSIAPNDERVLALDARVEKFSVINPKENITRDEIETRYQNALAISKSDMVNALAATKSIVRDDPGYLPARTLQARLEARLNEQKWRKPPLKISEKAEQFYAKGVIAYNTGKIKDAKNFFENALKAQPGFYRAKIAIEKCKVYLNS